VESFVGCGPKNISQKYEPTQGKSTKINNRNECKTKANNSRRNSSETLAHFAINTEPGAGRGLGIKGPGKMEKHSQGRGPLEKMYLIKIPSLTSSI